MRHTRRYQYFAAFGVSLAMMTTASAFFWTAPMLPKLLNNEAGFNLTSTEGSWVVSCMLPGSVGGSLVASVVADKFGRRSTILWSMIPVVIGTVFVLCATQAWMLYLARFFWGCGTGLITAVSSMYLSEIADKEIRGSLTLSTRVMFNFGATMVLIVGSLVSYEAVTYMILAMTISYFSICWWIPESPYFLLKEERVDKARKEIAKLSGLRNEKIIEDTLSAMKVEVRNQMTRSSSPKELFTGKRYRKAIIICVGLRVTQILAGSMAIQQYFGTIMLESNSGVEMSTAMIIFGVSRFLVGFVASAIVDRIGRRPLFIYSYIGTAIMLAINGTYFYYKDTISQIESFSRFRILIFIGLLICKVFSNLGYDMLVFVIPGEIFPLNVKATALSIYSVFSSIIAFAVMRGHQILKDLSGLHGVFWFYSIMAFSGGIFTYFFVPETKGKSLGEIQRELQGDLYEEDTVKLTEDENLKDEGMQNINVIKK